MIFFKLRVQCAILSFLDFGKMSDTNYSFRGRFEPRTHAYMLEGDRREDRDESLVSVSQLLVSVSQSLVSVSQSLVSESHWSV